MAKAQASAYFHCPFIFLIAFLFMHSLCVNVQFIWLNITYIRGLMQGNYGATELKTGFAGQCLQFTSEGEGMGPGGGCHGKCSNAET